MPELRKFLFKNFARSTLLADVTAAGATVTLQPGDGSLFPEATITTFPDSIFSIVLFADDGDFEVCYCTGRTGDVLTLQRGQEDTVSRAWPAGTVIVHTVTKGFLEQLSIVAAAPSAVVLSGELQVDSFELSWTAATPDPEDLIVQYEVYRRVNADPYELLVVVDGGVLTYLDEGLDALNNSYDWFVVPVGLFGGDGPDSNVVNQPQISFLLPTAPVLTGARETDDYADDYELSWTASTPGSGDTLASYQIYRRINGGAYSLLDTVSDVTLTYDDTTVDLGGNTYDWYVRAVGTNAGAGPASNTVSWGSLQYIDSECVATEVGTDLTISPPVLAQTGDFLLLAVMVDTGNATQVPAGWTALNQVKNDDGGLHADYATAFNLSYETFYAYRFMESGDTDWTLGVSVAGTEVIACIHAFRGVRTSRPIGQIVPTVVNHASGSANLGSGEFVPSPPMDNLAPGGMFVFTVAATRASSLDPVGSLSVPGETPILLEGHNLTPTVGSARWGMATLIMAPDQDELQNLIPYSHRNQASLSSTALTVTDNATSNTPSSWNPIETAGSRHEVYYDVTLTAGVTYTIAAHIAESGATTYNYIRVSDSAAGGTLEAGVVFSGSSSGPTKTADLGVGFSTLGVDFGAQRGTVSPGNAVFGTFVAEVTGTHRIAYGSTTSSTSDVSPSAITHGNTQSGWIGLYEGVHVPHLNKGSILTSGTAITAGNGVAARRIDGFTVDGTALGCAIELIPVGEVAEPCRVSGGDYLGCTEATDGLTIGPSVFGVSRSGGGPLHVVHPAYGPTKYYFETTFGAAFDSNTSERSFVGVQTAFNTNTFSSTLWWGNFDESRVGVFTYGNRGTVYADDDVFATGLDTFTASDTIGVGINFDDSEIVFWKIVGGSRTLVATVPFDGTYGDYTGIPLRPLVITTNSNSTLRTATLNFTGPFIDQPVGYSAYDWENEVT